MPRAPRFLSRMASSMLRLGQGDRGAGLILLSAALLAMVLANSPLAHGWHVLLHDPLPWTPIAKLLSLHHWVNDALMAVFFFVVGLEIKREVLDGDLSDPARRRLPVLAAAAGMALPALVYVLVAGTSPPLARGWAIPAATDIAFALGVLALAGKGLPPSLRLFLLTVAIVDDLGAVAIIALAYTPSLALGWSGAALGFLVLMALGNAFGVRRGWLYTLLGIALWYCVLHSGVHATVAGVLAAFCVPMKLDSQGDSLLLRMEHALTPWSAYLIVPLFGLANAGVELGNAGLDTLLAPLPLAVALGLLVGKQAGIFGAVMLAEKLGLAARPEGTTTLQLWGLALLCGIGFTMSLFIGGLAFPASPELVDEAKIGVLAGSLIAGLGGMLVLRLSRR